MVKISNIKIEELTFEKEKSAEFKQCLSLVPDLLDLLPKAIKYKVRFELHDTNSNLANAIRRCILNETSVKSLTYDENHDIDISDPYILSDFLKKQIDLIPIAQEIDYTNYSMELRAENKTDEIIDVTTKDFIIKNGNKAVEISEIMSPLIVICRLRPEEHLYIKNITVVEGIGRKDGAMFNNVSNIYYEPLENKTGASSMVSNPTRFLLGYTTHRNVKKPLIILTKACETLISRLEIIARDFVNVSNKDEYYYSDLLQLETDGNIKEIQFKNENWTVVNLISRICYNLTKGNIKFITPSNIHPEKEIAIIRIIHPEFSKLIQDSIKKAIEELNTIKKAV